MVDGEPLWRVRVDLFAHGGDGRRVQTTAEALRQTAERLGFPLVQLGVDQGTGAAGGPVIGCTFWVRGADVGDAANHAVATARTATAGLGIGPDLYEVVVIPAAAVADVSDPSYPDTWE